MTTTSKAKLPVKKGRKFFSYIPGAILSRASEHSIPQDDLPGDANEVPTSPHDNIGRAMSVPLLSLETKRNLSEKRQSQLVSFSKYDLNPGSDSENDLDLVSMSQDATYIDLSSVHDQAFKKSMRITKAILNKSKWELREYSDSIKFPEFSDDVIIAEVNENGIHDLSMSEETTQLVRHRIRTSVSLTRPSKLPPLPPDATETDRKRVSIIQEIFSTEMDYIRCLRKLLQLRDTILANLTTYGLAEDQVNRIFAYLPDILDNHEMFYIAISGKVHNVPTNFNIASLQLGPDCVSAFSKEIVAISYSKYSAQFTSILDIILQQRLSNELFSKQIKTFESESKDCLKISLLKPLQIFPKYIHMLSELIRYTEPTDQDYCSLTYALIGLESMAIRLGVVRREAELKDQFLQLQSRIITIGKDFFRSLSRKLLRIEPAIKLSRREGKLVPRFRFLFIFNDHIMCLRGAKKAFTADMLTPDPDNTQSLLSQYFLEWSVPIEHVDVKVREKAENIRTYREVSKILTEERTQKETDLDLLHRIDILVTQLYGMYPGLSKVSVQNSISHLARELKTNEIYTSLRNAHAIEVDLIRGARTKRYIFFLGTIETLKEFVLTIRYARLRILPENIQGWLTFSADSEHKLKSISNYPILVDTQVYNTMYANCSVNCGAIVGDCVVWVCCGNLRLGLIIILNTSGQYVEKLVQQKVCTERISVIHFMPPFQHQSDTLYEQWMYPTVWVGTENGRLYIFDASDPTQIDLNVETDCPDAVVCMENFCDKMFIGLANGDLMVFDTDTDGEWDGMCRHKIHLSEYSVTSLHVIDDQLWCFTGNNAILFSLTDLKIEQIVSLNSDPSLHVMLTAPFGRAIWLCLKQEPELLLFHVKHKEVLQTISLNRFFRQMRMEGLIETDSIRITSLMATHGSLWIGTSEGIVLNYELHDGVPVFVGQTSMSRDSHVETAKQFLYMVKNIGQRRPPTYPTPKKATDMLELEDGYWTQCQLEGDKNANPTNFEASHILVDGSLKLTRVSSDPTKTDNPIVHDFTSPLNSISSPTKKTLTKTTSFPPKKLSLDSHLNRCDPSIYDNTYKPTEDTIHERSIEDSVYEPIPAHLHSRPIRQFSSMSQSSADEAGPRFIYGGMPPPKPPRKSESCIDFTGTNGDKLELRTRIDSSDNIEVLKGLSTAEYIWSSLEESCSPTAGSKSIVQFQNPKAAEVIKALKNPKINKTKMEPKPGPKLVKPEPNPIKTEPKPVIPGPKPVIPGPKPVIPEPKPVKPEPKPVKPEPDTIDLMDPSNSDKIWELVDEIQISRDDIDRDPYVVMKSPSKMAFDTRQHKLEPNHFQFQRLLTREYQTCDSFRDERRPRTDEFDGYSLVKRNLELTDDLEQVPFLSPPTNNEYFVLSSSENKSDYSKIPKLEYPMNPAVRHTSTQPTHQTTQNRQSGLYTKLKSLKGEEAHSTYEKLILDGNGRPITLSPQKEMPSTRARSESDTTSFGAAYYIQKDRLSERESAWVDIHMQSYYVISVGNGYFDWRAESSKPLNEGSTNPTLIMWEIPFMYNL